METINSPWLGLVATAAFLCICYAAWPYGHAEAGYDRSVFAVMDHQTAGGITFPAPIKVQRSAANWKAGARKAIDQWQKEKIMDLWNISEDDLRQPVRIFGE